MPNNNVTITGRNGFIGSELSKIKLPDGVYFFGSPSSVIQFDEDLSLCMRETIGGFISYLDRCKRTGEYLVYPSSATVKNKNTAYARCKSILEELHQAYDIPALGLRIAAGYGPNEGHKGEYASVVYQWCQLMKKGKRPTLWGDGTQTRDFIYIDDIVENIHRLAKQRTTGIVELGTGINTSFNEVVHTINKVLGTNIEPIYIGKPKNYIESTPVKACDTNYTLEDGIRKILNA